MSARPTPSAATRPSCFARALLNRRLNALLLGAALGLTLSLGLRAQTSGRYCGAFAQLYLNGARTLPAGNFCTHITRLDAESFSLLLPPFRSGRMPARLSIWAPRVRLRPDGSFDERIAGAIRLHLLGETRFDARLHGRFAEGRLSYALESIDARFLFRKIDARFAFEQLSPSKE